MTGATKSDPLARGSSLGPRVASPPTTDFPAVAGLLATLAADTDIPSLCQSFARELRRVFGADHVALGTIALDSRRRTILAFDSGVMRPAHLPGALAPEDVESYLAALTGSAHCIHDLSQVRASDGIAPVMDAGLRALVRASFPLSDGRVGLVTVGSLEAGRYTPDDAAFLMELCRPLGLAMDRATLRSEAANDRAVLEAQTRVLAALGPGVSIERIAEIVVHEARRLFAASHAQVFTAAGAEFDVLALSSDQLATDQVRRLPRLGPPDALQSTSSEIVADLATLHRGPIENEAFSTGLRSIMRAPILRSDGTATGFLTIGSRAPHAYTPGDVRRLTELASAVALVGERTLLLQEAQEHEARYRSLVTQAQEMIIIVDSETFRVLEANDYTAQRLGYSPDELPGASLDDLAPGFPPRLQAHLAGEAPANGGSFLEQDFRAADGRLVEVEVNASTVAFGGRKAVFTIARDISERRALLRERMHAQKMESLGKMAGSVAHDFNNLLTAILGFAGLLRHSAGLQGENQENLLLIEDAAKRAAELTRRLLSFARGGQSQFGPVDLGPVVEDTVRLLEPALSPLIRVTRSLPSRPVVINGDRSQVEQAITNIVLNAREAMPTGGQVHIRLSTEERSAVLSIADSGPGMTEETRARIFEPFFTTKAGSGTGLGMAITYGVVQGHHGQIAVETALGAGTTFTITLPLSD